MTQTRQIDYAAMVRQWRYARLTYKERGFAETLRQMMDDNEMHRLTDSQRSWILTISERQCVTLMETV